MGSYDVLVGQQSLKSQSDANDEWRWGGKPEIRRYNKFLSVTILFMVCLSFLSAENFASAQTGQVNSKLQTATAAVNQAFDAVQSAEKAGANVTTLLNQLNVATGLLAQAENAYRTGDNNTAVSNAENIINISQQVMSAAQSAEQTATASSQTAFWTTIAYTVIGAAVFLVVLFMAWRLLKARYTKNLQESRPEAVEQ